MAFFELIHLLYKLDFYETPSYKKKKNIFKITAFVVNNLLSVQPKQESNKDICFTAGP